MMKRLYAALLSGVFLLPSLRAAEELPMVEIPDSLVSPEPEMEQSDFALRLFQQQVRQTQGNVTCSPSSLVSVLRMLQIGARGETAAGLSALKLPLPLLRATIDMQEADALFVDDKLAPVLKNFARRHDVVPVPMVSDAQQAARRVNDWVSGRTGGRIPELVTPESLQAVGAYLPITFEYFRIRIPSGRAYFDDSSLLFFRLHVTIFP
jgi:serine protease inhibitor